MIRMRKERLLKEWTLAEVGRRVKLDPSNLSAIENGRLKPWKKITKKLEKLFRLKAEELFSQVQEGGRT
ncbi:MAG: helix-turn-helix domain-containing protein [Vulcanimicrobiota bacterium]